MAKKSKRNNFDISVSLVVPVYNGELVVVNQLKLCEKILNRLTNRYEIIVADDKSKDNTANLIKQTFTSNKNFKLIFNKYNIGIAKNIKKLYSIAKYKYICLYSADGDWKPYDIRRLVIHGYKNNSDIVIGKRDRKVYSPYRRIVSFFYNFLPYLFFRIKTIDAGSIKVIRKDLFHSTPIISKSVFFEAEIIIRATRKGRKILSLPIYFKRQKNKKSSDGKITLIISSLIDIIKLRLKI